MERSTTEKFIKKAINIHGNEYDYSLVEYKFSNKKVKIICPVHGIFEQSPNQHLSKKTKCPECMNNKKLDTNSFIKKSVKIHGYKYDYCLSNVNNNHDKIKIICHKHGMFEQTPNSHLSGSGCYICGYDKLKKNIFDFIKESNIIHHNKYDYSLVEDKLNKKVKIICPVHGIFEQLIKSHLSGSGCPKCKGWNKTTIDFIKESNDVHDNKYIYSLTKYKGSMKKLQIICPSHGIFEQTPNRHLSGCGCPKCKETRGEKKIRKFLTDNKINFEFQKRFDSCKNKYSLPFDFYLPDHNICIEYNGLQHYEEIEHFGGIETLKYIKNNDFIKNIFCKNNNINLITIKYNENIYDILSNLKNKII